MYKKIIGFIKHKLIYILSLISNKLSSKYLYYIIKQKKLNLKNPVLFNEKLMYLKIYNYNKNKLVWKCSDKYCMREFVLENGIGKMHLPKLLFIYDNVNDIDFDKLPNKFALKCTHGSGFNIICTDKNKLNKQETVKKLGIWLNTKFGKYSAENHYNHIKPKIICEQFIEYKNDEYPIDYKLYCFNGEPKITLVCTERKNGYKTSFYDMNWNRIKLRENEDESCIVKPKSFSQMVKISKKLSKCFPFVRVDFYESSGIAIIGEMTFTPAACLGEYTDEAEIMLGNWLSLDD